MGEAKRRKELGIPRRERKEIRSNINKVNGLYKLINRYPYLPYILGFSLLTILIIDLVNFYN